MERSYRKSYKSIILSLLVHGLLMLFCALFLKQREQNQHTLPNTPNYSQSTPAKVSLQAFPPGELDEPLEQQTASPEASNPPDEQTLTQPLEAQNFIQETAGNLPEDSTAHDSVDQQEGPARSTGSPQGMSDATGTSTRKTKKKKRSKLTGAAFMGAFQRSVNADREAAATAQASRQSSTGATLGGGGDAPAHVQERLDEWQYAHYHEKIAKTLIKTAALHRKMVTTPVDINVKLPFTLIIGENGEIINIPTQTLTGAEELDEFIREFFKKAQFPPIPPRFNLKEFPFKLNIRLTLSQGGHYLQLTPQAD